MKSSKLALALVFLLPVGQVFAQDVAFKVLMNKGQNEVKSGNAWVPLKTGASLKPNDELKLVQNGYIGLAHASGKAVELNKAGNYKVSVLSSQVGGEGSSVLNKYTDFILSSNSGPKNTLVATGAVNRGTGSIKVYLPKPELSVVYDNTVIISWDNSVKGPYLITFKSMFGDELKTAETAENVLSISLADRDFENEDNIIVQVFSKADKSKVSDEYTLKKLSKADKVRIKGALGEIATQTAEATAINQLVLAGFYEQNSLLIDANTAYQEALKLAPHADAREGYEELYINFLERHGLKEAASKK